MRKLSGAENKGRSLSMRKSRAVTRANAKKGREEEKLTMRNQCGYLEPTAYYAVRNIEGREIRRQDKSV